MVARDVAIANVGQYATRVQGDKMRQSWGWAGTAEELISTPDVKLLSDLEAHHLGLLGMGASEAQRISWTDLVATLQQELRALAAAGVSLVSWSIVLEYELPLEGGRRPDAVILAGGSIIVIEHKLSDRASQAWVDQAGAYARDLSDYHERSHGRSVDAVLLLGRAQAQAELRDDVVVCGPGVLAEYLRDRSSEGEIALQDWLESDYAPLPTLVAAARRLFEHEPLPHVRTALAAGIPDALDLLDRLTREAEAAGRRLLVFVTGVPGAGKTLVGLRYVYEQSNVEQRATFLSGNGPLVQVLRDALKSKVFVKDLHAYITQYGITERTPKEPIVVFDEAQRAWDRAYMEHKKRTPHSEPDLLIRIGQRIEPWASFVGLVGTGQEIHSGEEGGIEQWRVAVVDHGGAAWDIHCPENLAPSFAGLDVTTHSELDLDVTLRSRRADELHSWVADVLQGNHRLAARRALRVHQSGFALYLTRSLDEAKTYARARYDGQPEARYGLLASSHAKRLERDFGIANGFMATSRMNIAKWFNAPVEDAKSGCQLDQPITEFQCQGLEVDLPIVCWGDDLRWTGDRWLTKPVRRQYPLDDPDQILQNTYRVLLSRGRDGALLWIPPHPDWDRTEEALLTAGVRPLPEDSALAGAIDGAAAEEVGGYLHGARPR